MRRGLAWVGILAGLAARPAPAADPPIAVGIPECATAPLPIDAFLTSLRVELAAEGQPCCARVPVDAPAKEPRNPVSVAIAWTCAAGSDQVTIQVRHERTGADLHRQVALGDVSADARPRALALAAAELIRSAGVPPLPPPAPPAAPPPPASAADLPALDGWLPNAGLAVRTFPSGNLTLWGFHGGVGYARAGWAAAIELFIESGNPTVPLGSVDTTYAGGQLRLGRRFRLARTPFEVGAAGGLGVVHMAGVTTVPGATVESGSALVWTAGVRVAYDFWRIPNDRARLRLMLEGGGVVRGMEATVNGQDAVGVTGFYLMGGLAFTLGPYGH